MKNGESASNNNNSNPAGGGNKKQMQSEQSQQQQQQQGFESDDHDDFNPINDLMPPSIVGSETIDTIGKKRARENDPLRRLMEESSADEISKDLDAPTKRLRTTQGDSDVHQSPAASAVVSSDQALLQKQQQTSSNNQIDAKQAENHAAKNEPVVDPESASATDKMFSIETHDPATAKKEEGSSEFSPTNARSMANSSNTAANAADFGKSAAGVAGVNLIEKVDLEEEPPRKKKKSNKTVKWASQEDLEQVKYFKMNDEPNKAGLSLAEVQEIQKHLADVPAHLIPSEIQKIEMQLDGRLLRERKSLDSQLRIKLVEMKPQIQYRRPLMRVNRGSDFNLGLGEKSNEVSIQKHREADKFRYYAPNPQSQSNPVLELDEFYCKDEKIPKIDLETFAKDHNKEKEGIKFEQDMAKLTKELEHLDEDQKKRICSLLMETREQPPNVLINLANEAINKYKEINSEKRAKMAQINQMAVQQAAVNMNMMIKPSNFRTVPCRNYHGPQGCTRGEYCHFIHAQGFEGREIAREVFQSYRNQNIRMNCLQEIQKIVPKAYEELQNAPYQVIQQFVANHNAKIQGTQPNFPAQTVGIGTPHLPLTIPNGIMQHMQSMMPGQPNPQLSSFIGNLIPGVNPGQQQPFPQGGIPQQQQPGFGPPPGIRPQGLALNNPQGQQQPPNMNMLQQQAPQHRIQGLQAIPPNQQQMLAPFLGGLLQNNNQGGGNSANNQNGQQQNPNGMHLNQLLLQHQYSASGNNAFNGSSQSQQAPPQQQNSNQSQPPPPHYNGSGGPGNGNLGQNKVGANMMLYGANRNDMPDQSQSNHMSNQNSVNFQQAQLVALLGQQQQHQQQLRGGPQSTGNGNVQQQSQLLLQQLQNQVNNQSQGQQQMPMQGNQQQQQMAQQNPMGQHPLSHQQQQQQHAHQQQSSQQQQASHQQNGVQQLLQQLQGLHE